MLNNDDISTVVSVCPFPITKTIPHTNPSSFHIPACGDGEVKSLLIGTAINLIYLDADRGYQERELTSASIARSIVEDHINSSMNAVRGHAEPGLFWARGEYDDIRIELELTKELQIARDRQKRWFIALVEQADKDWAKTHSPRSISDLQRIAAKKLQLRKEWDIERIVDEISNCPACQKIVHPKAFLCECGFILDLVQYEENKQMFVRR